MKPLAPATYTHKLPPTEKLAKRQSTEGAWAH